MTVHNGNMYVCFFVAVNLGIGQATGESARIFFDSVTKESSALFDFTFSTTEFASCKDIIAYGKVRNDCIWIILNLIIYDYTI